MTLSYTMFQLFIILLAVCFVFNFQIIVGGVQEEISLQQLMDEVNLEVTEEFNATSGDIPEEEIVTKVQERLQSKCE